MGSKFHRSTIYDCRVRVENTHTNYTGNVVEDEEKTANREIKNDYTNFLPSLASVFPTTNIVVRAAYSTALLDLVITNYPFRWYYSR